jgi:ankyrin repeat protein/beta-lactamase regulating signal transducer with metallopeptidase domain
MNLAAAPFCQAVIIALGWALLHFLWQGASIALLLAAANLCSRKESARLRYAAYCVAMLLMLVALITTFVWLSLRSAPGAAGPLEAVGFAHQTTAALGTTGAPAISTDSSFRWEQWLDGHLAWMVCAWFVGVATLSLRTAGGWVLAQVLKRRARPAEPSWQQTLMCLASRFGIRRRIALRESTRGSGPAVIGWLRPVILLPVSVLAGLTPQMMEAILAHELAHIRRHDYFLNMLQTAVETLLFYHPAVWWVGKKIRQEREHCCDDAAVAACGDALIYARALTALEQFRCAQPSLAMAASGGPLLARIRRLVGVRQPVGRPASTWLTGVVALLIVGGLWTARSIATVYHGRELTSYAAAEPMQGSQPTLLETRATELVAQASSPDTQSVPPVSHPATSSPVSPPGEVTPGQMFKRATKNGDLTTIETLLSIGFDPSGAVDGQGYTPLWYAIVCGRTDVVDLLLAAHADPNARVMAPPPFYATPLQLALQEGKIDIASRLVAAGAHVDVKGANGRTALYDAVTGVQLDAIRFLIDRGADVNVRDTEGASPLDDAVWHGTLDSVALLLAHGARLNEPDSETGATPINEAAFMGNTPVVRYLLQFHPDLGTPDKHGYTPLDNALRLGKEDTALLLLEAEPKELHTPQRLRNLMDPAIRKDEPRLIEALVRHGVSVNGTLPSGVTFLDAAAFAGSTKIVRVLLDNGADPNITGQNGATPLEDASLKGFDSIVNLLLDHGALVNGVNTDSGATALYAAASFGKGGVVKLLLGRGANPNLCGNSHKSPYAVALDNGYKDVAAEIKLHDGGSSCQQ